MRSQQLSKPQEKEPFDHVQPRRPVRPKHRGRHLIHFSANLGFLWQDRSLPDAIHAAKDAGFAAVECHWPYAIPAKDIRAALADTGLPLISLNTIRGDTGSGENGLAALPDHTAEARTAIDEAVSYAVAVQAKAVHVMAGIASGEAARGVFLSNLAYASEQAAQNDITILIEPLNRHDAPGYFLRTTDQAVDIIAAVGARNLKLMFDCYHVERTEGDVMRRLQTLRQYIGHIQFAGVPDRGPPDTGELDYAEVFRGIHAMGYRRPLGAEYRPSGPTDQSLDWMKALSCSDEPHVIKKAP